jgi:hypothetical protein
MIREKITNTTIKNCLNLMDGLGEMVEERLARQEMQLTRSQSAELASGWLRDSDGVDDLQIMLKNLKALRMAVNDNIDAVVMVANGALNVQHDHEEMAINRYTGDTIDDTK